MAAVQKKTLHCSFCGKSQYEVRKMIEGGLGPTFICNECVALCVDIIREADEAKYVAAEATAH